MANYSIALGVQPPQINTANALALANQMQRQKAADLQNQQAMELERERFGLQKQRFGLQQQQFQSTLAAREAELREKEARRNALAEYTKAQQGGDENALSRLSAYPELQQKVLAVRNSMAEAERGEFDQRLIRNARRAQTVMGLQGEAKQQAWTGALDEALQAGDITPEMHQQYSQQPPNDLLLQNIVQQAVPIQQLYQQPTAKMQELESAGIEPGTPEYRAQVAPAALPRYEKMKDGRLIRLDGPDGPVDVTPPTAAGVVAEEPPSNYRWQIDPATGQPALDASGRPIAEPVPGGPATKLPGDQAAKLAAMQTAVESMESAKSFFENMDAGDRANKVLNRGEAGRAERTVRLAVESALRAMTGAAAPEHEVDQYMDLFGPSVWDTSATIADKLKRLESFIGNVQMNLSQGRGGVPSTSPSGKDQSRLTQGTANDPLGILD